MTVGTRPALADLDVEPFATWLPHRRWYAGKEHAIDEVGIDDVIALPHDSLDVALVMLHVVFDDGSHHRYAIPVMSATGPDTGRILATAPDAVIARIGRDELVVDAMAVPEGAAAVVGAALREHDAPGRVGSAHGRPRRAGSTVPSPDQFRLLGVEQSNSSVIVDDRMIAKLVRRIEPGVNPDVDLPEFLAGTDFGQVPGLIATLDVQPGTTESAAASGPPEPCNVVIVHDAVPNEGDLFERMLTAFGESLDTTGPADRERPAELSLEVAELLGRRTAELHGALAGARAPGMTPLPFALDWQEVLLDELRAAVTETQRALLRAGVGSAPELLEPVDRVLRRFEPLHDTRLEAMRIRVHGDLHLGQILWTGDDIVFIDFEGEPGRPMRERHELRSPLIDLAGLLRSIDYAGRIALDRAAARGQLAADGRDGVAELHEAWMRELGRTVTESYLATVPPGLVPSDRDAADLLLAVFLLQKGLYEVRYELSNRPAWVHWPLSAVVEMIQP